MPIELTPIPSATGTTLADIEAQARHFLDELAEGRLVTDPAGQFGLRKAVQEAYVEYSKRTRCFPVTATISTADDTATYDYGDTTPANRLFTIEFADYDGTELRIVAPEYLDANMRGWRTESKGTPAFLVSYGEQKFRLYPKPSAVKTLTLEGFETPDLTLFATDSDVPLIHSSRCRLLAAYAAVIVAVRFANVSEAQIQKADCYNIWESGVKDAIRELHGSVEADTLGSQRYRPFDVNPFPTTITD